MDNNNSQLVTLNMEAVRQTARQRYIAARKHKRTLRDWIEAAIPTGLLIIVIAAILLSAPHTIAMFNIITPGMGLFGVFLIEFGLMYLAFRRRQQGKLPGTLRAFEVLLFGAAIIVNGSGALIAAASVTGIQSMSAGSIYAQFGVLPINAQVGLALAALAAVLIPIATIVSGEGFANFVLQDKQADRDLENDWQQSEQLEVYREAYSHLLHQGINPRDAQRRAGSATTNFYQAGLTIEIGSIIEAEPAIAAVSTPRLPKRSKLVQKGRSIGASEKVNEYLNEHPEALTTISQNQLAKSLGVSVGTVNAIFKSRQDDSIQK